MKKAVQFNVASETELRAELRKVREDNERLAKKDERNNTLINTLHEDFRKMQEEIKESVEIRALNKQLMAKVSSLESSINSGHLVKQLKQELSEVKMTVVRLRATMELLSTELVLEGAKNKQMISALNQMTKEIEKQGNTEKEKNFIYNQMKKAFIEKWNCKRNSEKSSKISGTEVLNNVRSLLSTYRVELPERVAEQESLLMAQAQDSIVSLAERAGDLLNLMSARHSLTQPEEEILITVKRKRGASQPLYTISSSSLSGVEQQLVSRPMPNSEDGNELGGSGVEEDSHPEDQEMDFSLDVTRFLEDYRNSVGQS